MSLVRPTMMGITEIDGEFWWSVSFTNDPRLPLMGRSGTFDKALAAVRTTIKAATQAGPIPSVDRRPAGLSPGA